MSNVVDFIVTETLCSCKTVLRHTTQQFLRENRQVSCWWQGVVFSRSQSPGLLHLRYHTGFGVRRPTTSVHKFTGPQRGYHKQTESGLPWDVTVRKFIAQWKRSLIAVKEQSDGAIQHIFRQFLW